VPARRTANGHRPAPHQAFDIQALYKPDMNQVTIFTTLTTSTPTPSP
jgi:hypothetical protein